MASKSAKPAPNKKWLAHQDLCEAAETAISAVHGDTSVGQRDTLDSLRLLKGHVQILIDAVESDMPEDE